MQYEIPLAEPNERDCAYRRQMAHTSRKVLLQVHRQSLEVVEHPLILYIDCAGRGSLGREMGRALLGEAAFDGLLTAMAGGTPLETPRRRSSRQSGGRQRMRYWLKPCRTWRTG